ncbi:MAG TPA: hypothetical protein VFB50_05970, partial [Chloroflexota bacterium]|nr:hypothetical protein [Chloroflexota bacterium]
REFAQQGIAVNSLWPRTTIATAAVEVFFPESVQASRKPEIVADAAYLIVTSDSRTTTAASSSTRTCCARAASRIWTSTR